MKSIALLFTVLCLATYAQAQQSIIIKYDQNGNRVLRHLKEGSNRPANADDRDKTLSKTKNIEKEKHLNALADDKIMLYPNPTTGKVSIKVQLSDNKSQEWFYTITDITGKEIFTQKAKGDQSAFDISAYADGFYTCTVWIGTEPSTFKFVKNKN